MIFKGYLYFFNSSLPSQSRVLFTVLFSPISMEYGRYIYVHLSQLPYTCCEVVKRHTKIMLGYNTVTIKDHFKVM
jgi:hypothetical protein